MPPQVRPKTLNADSNTSARTSKDTCLTLNKPTATHTHTTLLLIVGVVLLFTWSPLMDHRPLKRVSLFLLSSLTPSLLVADACLHVSRGRGRGDPGLSSFHLALSLSSSLPITLSFSLSVSLSLSAKWCQDLCMTDIVRGAIPAYGFPRGMFWL